MASGIINKSAKGNDTGWQTIRPNSNVASGTIDYRIVGDVAMIRLTNIKLASSLAANSTRILATVSEETGLKPSGAVRGTGGTNLAPMNLILNPTGNISIGGVALDTATAVSFNVIYLLG